MSLFVHVLKEFPVRICRCSSCVISEGSVAISALKKGSREEKEMRGYNFILKMKQQTAVSFVKRL